MSLADFLAAMGHVPEAPPEPKAQPLSSFLSALPLPAEASWRALPPPSLDGIDDVIVNVETNGLDWANGDRPIGITVGTLDGSLKQFMPFAFRGGGNLDEAQVKHWAQHELRGKNITNANTRFDVHMFREWGIDLEEQGCTVSDVQHYAALLDDHRKRFGIDVLAKELLGGIEVPRMDERDMQQYAAYEVAARAEYQVKLVADLRNVMWPQLDEQNLQRVRLLEDDVIFPVCEMEKNGAQIDVALLEQFDRDSLTHHHRLLKEIEVEAGFPFDLSTGSWTRLFEKYHVPLKMRASGKASFAEDVVGRIEHPIIQKAHLADQYSTLNSKTFAAYKRLIDKNGVLRFQINQLRGDEGGTVSGRFSIGYVQQVPNADNHHKVFGNDLFPRKLFVAKQGQVLSADAAQIEYRIFATYAKSIEMQRAYEKDPKLSFHRMTYDMIRPYKPDLLYTEQKSLNFMKMYGGGLIKIAVMLGHITADVGEEIRRAKTARTDPRLQRARDIESIYSAKLPEVKNVQRKAMYLAQVKCDQYCKQGDYLHTHFEHRGYVQTYTGRRSRFREDDFKTYIALNRMIQGTAADYNKTKIVELHRSRKQTGFLMRLTVHDEVMGDAQTEETAQRVADILARQAFEKLKVPILWETHTGPDWAACK